MAQEKWTVIFGQQHAGYGPAIPFKNQTEAVGGETPTEICRVATILAGSGQEAATAIRKAFGEGLITGKVRVIKTSNVEEKSA